jgi:hypothetical protein
MTRYRIVVGEIGNEQGHIIPTSATDDAQARAALRQALKPYGRDGWGRIERNETPDNDATWSRE